MAERDAEFGMVEPFYIDKGELDGLSPQECFVLGVEWQMVADAADKPEGFVRSVHTSNVYRLSALLRRRDREFRFSQYRSDPSGQWMNLKVEPLDS